MKVSVPRLSSQTGRGGAEKSKFIFNGTHNELNEIRLNNEKLSSFAFSEVFGTLIFHEKNTNNILMI